MDLNYLYQRHQVSLFMAQNGASNEVRSVHGEFVELYAARIAQERQARRELRAA